MPVAEIVGGGIAGLTTALILARRGWSVRVHERTPELRASGNGIVIWENGIRVLEALDLAPDVVEYGNALRKWAYFDNLGRPLRHYDTGSDIGFRSVIFTRQSLIDLLSRAGKAAGVEIALGSQIAGANARGELIMQDGARRAADLVVGADGIFSTVRRSLFGDLPLDRHRKGATRILIPAEPDDFMDGTLNTVIEYNHPEGRRFGIIPCSHETLYVILVSMSTDTEAHATPINAEFWKRSYPNLGRMIDRIGDRGHYDAYYSIATPSWHDGRCALVGDAAHGMTPAIGQGACSALMSAYALGHADFDGAAQEVALAGWEASIRPLIDFAQKFSAEVTAGRIDPRMEGTYTDPTLRPLLEADIPRRFVPRPAYS